MGDDREKTIRILPFSGKKEHWAVWKEKFLARAKRKGHKGRSAQGRREGGRPAAKGKRGKAAGKEATAGIVSKAFNENTNSASAIADESEDTVRDDPNQDESGDFSEDNAK